MTDYLKRILSEGIEVNSRFYLLLLCTILCLPMLVSCQEVANPREVLSKAILAHGGDKNISKPRRGILTGKTKSEGSPRTQEEEIFELPARWKRTVVGKFDGKQKTMHSLMIDGKLWEWDDDGDAQLAKNQTGSESSFGPVTKLLFLSSDKATLLPLAKTMVKGRSSSGVRATWEAGAVDCFFDDKTGLLAQVNFEWEPQERKKFISKTVYDDYKDIDGVKFPHRRASYIKGGEFKDYVLLVEIVIADVRILEKLPDDAFALPKKK